MGRKIIFERVAKTFNNQYNICIPKLFVRNSFIKRNLIKHLQVRVLYFGLLNL